MTGGSIAQLFRTRDFTLLWIGRVISFLGDWLLFVALPVWVYQLTGSTAALGLMVVAETIPGLVLAPLAGVLVDRWDRRKVMAVADGLRAVIVLALLFVQSPERVPLIYAVGFVNAALGTFFVPARQSLLPSILGPSLLLRGNAVFQMSWLIIQTIGPIAGGVLLAQMGPYPLFVLDSASFVVSAVAAWLVSAQLAVRSASNGWHIDQLKAEFMDGLHVLRGNPILWNTMLVWVALTLAQGSINPLIVAYVKDALGGTTADFATLLTLLGAGMVGGAVLAISIGHRWPALRLFKGGLFVFAPAILVVANAPNLVLAVIAVCLTGLVMAVVGVSYTTIFQQATPAEYRARVLSADSALHSLAILVAAGTAGMLAEPFGVRVVFNLAAALVVVAAVFAAWRLRRAS